VVRGFAWNLVSVVGLQVSRLVVGITLARLLTPHEYGLAAMALVFSGLILAFSDLALGAGLVQRDHITEDDRSTVFWTCALVGLGLTVSGVLASGPLAAFYGSPSVRPLFAVLSISFVITALGMTQAALLQREMNFRATNFRILTAAGVGGIIGIAAAAAGFGAWALIAQQIAVSSISTLLLWRLVPWSPRFTYSLSSLRSLGAFGVNLLGSRLLDFLKGGSQSLLVGRYLGASSLGAYTVAYNIMLIPLQRLMVPIQDTLFPAFSRMQGNRTRLGESWLRVNRVVFAVVAPISLGLIVVAPDLISTLLGHRWHAAGPVLQILAIAALFQSFSALGTKVLAALDRVNVLLRYSLAGFATTIAAFAVGLQWGIVGVAACFTAVVIPVELTLLWITAKSLQIPLLRVARSVAGVLQAGLSMILLCLPARLALVSIGVAPAVRLVAVIVLGALVYIPICAWRATGVVQELRTVRGTLRPARAAG
jgi:O-antigen/teichoic acid export membrane protein